MEKKGEKTCPLILHEVAELEEKSKLNFIHYDQVLWPPKQKK